MEALDRERNEVRMLVDASVADYGKRTEIISDV